MDREPQGYFIIMLSLLALQAVIQDNFFQLCYNPLLLLYGMVLMRGPEEDEWESPMLERLRARRRGGTGGPGNAVPAADGAGTPEPDADDRFVI